MKNLVFEALYDFYFRNIDTGLCEFINKGERYRVVKMDNAEQKVHIESLDGNTTVIISIYKFASHFGEVKQ